MASSDFMDSMGAKATRLGAACLVAAAVLLPAGVASAQDQVTFQVMVSHVSQTPGSIDPRGGALHAVLKREIRYESLKVLDTQVLALRLNDIGTVKLPTGRRVRLRPMDLGEDGVLVAIEIEGSTQADLRVPNRRIVVIGGQPYQDGRLVISLEPRY